MITEETDAVVKVVVDPLANSAATIIRKHDIEDQTKLNVSLMPQGLLDKLSREEILDLVAYVYTRGNKQDKLFLDHGHQH